MRHDGALLELQKQEFINDGAMHQRRKPKKRTSALPKREQEDQAADSFGMFGGNFAARRLQGSVSTPARPREEEKSCEKRSASLFGSASFSRLLMQRRHKATRTLPFIVFTFTTRVAMIQRLIADNMQLR